MNITPGQQQKIEKIGQEYDLSFIILHGFHAKGTQQKGSDLDIAILGNKRISGEETLKIYGEFADIFGDNHERELDLKTLHGVDSLFRYEVTQGGTLLFGNPTYYEEFKLYAYRSYMDSYDLRELQEILLKKSIREILHHDHD